VVVRESGHCLSVEEDGVWFVLSGAEVLVLALIVDGVEAVHPHSLTHSLTHSRFVLSNLLNHCLRNVTHSLTDTKYTLLTEQNREDQ
jgi:hypothetical protein